MRSGKRVYTIIIFNNVEDIVRSSGENMCDTREKEEDTRTHGIFDHAKYDAVSQISRNRIGYTFTSLA